MTSENKLSRKLFEKGKTFTISNGLSFIRLIGGIYLFYLLRNHEISLGLIVSIVLIMTDFLDGFFARRMNQISELGKVLDPLADKVAIGLATIALYLDYGLPLWMTVIIVGRDVAIILGSLILMKRLPYVTPSAMPGKIAVTILAFMALAYLLQVKPLQLPLLILSLAGIIISSGFYAHRFLKQIKEETPREGIES